MRLTPTERRMYEVLKDGTPHDGTELRRLLNDDLAGVHALHTCIARLRKKLDSLEVGEVVCVSAGRKPSAYLLLPKAAGGCYFCGTPHSFDKLLVAALQSDSQGQRTPA